MKAAGTVCKSSGKLIGMQQGPGIWDYVRIRDLLPGFSSNDFAHFEDREIHRNHHPADQCTEDYHDHRLHQA